jgi:hypothetical protein
VTRRQGLNSEPIPSRQLWPHSAEVYHPSCVRGFPWRPGTLDLSTRRRLGGEVPRPAATAADWRQGPPRPGRLCARGRILVAPDGRCALPIERRARRFRGGGRTLPGPPVCKRLAPKLKVSDHVLSRQVVVFDLRGLTGLAGEKRDKRAQNGPGSSKPFARDFDDRVRPPGFAQLPEHHAGVTSPRREA